MYPLLFVIDLDRTLTNVTNTSKVLGDVCTSFDISDAGLHAAQKQSEENGESFSELQYVLNNLPKEISIDQVKERYIKLVAKTEIMYKDSFALLHYLEQQNIPFIIATYGDVILQKLKIEAAGLSNYPQIILSHTIKGGLIATWRKDDGLYYPDIQGTVLSASSVILVDDKAKSFTNLPNDCSGFLIRRTDEPVLKSQEGTVPKNVQKIATLEEITAIITL